MSEMESAAPEAAPTSTADIAASVIESAEQEAASVPETPSEPPARIEAEPKTEPTKAEAKSDASRAAEFLRKMGHQLQRSDGKRAFMPLDTVAKMLDSYVEEHTTGWTSERQTLESKAKETEAQLASLVSAMKADPKAFLQEIATHLPAYKAFLEPPAGDEDPEPTPDYDLGNGSRTYSVEGLAKREAWLRRQIAREIDAKLKPLTEREQQERQRQERDALDRQHGERVSKLMTEAQSWPLFGQIAKDGTLTPFQQEVMDAFMGDKSLTLHAAYMQVALPRLTEDDTKKRERLLKEIETAPKAPATPRGPSDGTKRAGPMSTTEIARSVISKLESSNA